LTDLRGRIAEMIRAGGPMPVSLYMTLCLHDPRAGYYATRAGFNRDFTTAPETSQVFGELLGLWLAQNWRDMGEPARLNLIELGPGRGTMVRDILRVTDTIPNLPAALDITLIEASPLLRQLQADLLKGRPFRHADTLDAAPAGPAIILANEFLDCLPIRQFVRIDGLWRERQVGLDTAGDLAFGLGPPAELPADVTPTADEAEYAPALDTLIDALAERLRQHPSRALFIDYGPHDATPADTLRAYRDGRQVHPLAEPGASDLTADVDFTRLRHVAEHHGLAVHGPISQHDFLTALGIRHREKTLTAANPARAAEITAAIAKLVSPDQMGERFRLTAISSPDLPTPPGF
jgi:SAM-dependent MidA family methyltransferase